MKTIKNIDEKIEKLNVLKKEMEKKVSEYCNGIKVEYKKRTFGMKEASSLGGAMMMLFICISSMAFFVHSQTLINSMLYGLIGSISLTVLPIFVAYFVVTVSGETHYEAYLRNEKIKAYIFGKEDIEKYYGFLNSIYGEELEFILKNEMKENEEIGNYHLLSRLFEKALVRLNEEKISLKLESEKENAKNAKNEDCAISKQIAALNIK